MGLAELLHDEEDEQILAEPSPVSPRSPQRPRPLPPVQGKSRARKIEDFVASATFEVTDE